MPGMPASPGAPGSWPSPLSAADVARVGTSHASVALSDGGGTAWWLERRPAEGGRGVVLRRTGDGPVVEVGAGFDARTRFHEYGGLGFVPYGTAMVASSWSDQRLWVVGDGEPRALTPDTGGADRYADPQIVGEHVLVLRERVTPGVIKAANALVAVRLDGTGEPVVLWDGSDFVDHARVSADGSQVAFLTWEHPRMPWDGTELRVAELLPGPALGPVRVVLGGAETSLFQPEWEPGGTLRVVSDASGWWNLVRVDPRVPGTATPLWPVEQECGWPAWTPGQGSHGESADGAVAVVHGRSARQLSVLRDGQPTTLDLPFTTWSQQFAVQNGTAIGIAATPTTSPAVVTVDLRSGAWRLVAGPEQPDPDWAPLPEQVQVPSAEGRSTFAHLYPPTSPTHGPATGPAPWVVYVHGGPTAHSIARYDAEKAFWTSRGFGVADVDHGGSTGQGRPYRDSLRGRWGVVDVQDCEAVARWLLSTGRASAVVIRGGSAGGWTVLSALTRGDSVFAAGASYYGVADLVPFAESTHDFESHYLDSLVGPLPAARALYDERSPLSHLDRLDRPLLVLQGTDDKVVPPAQAELLLAGLVKNAVPHAYLPFAGEGHGFVNAANVAAALEAELSFYGQVLGFDTPGVAPVTLVTG